jgi:hypothetical protein
MSPATVSRLIPRVVPVNPRAHRDVRHAQAALDSGMADAVNALQATPNFGLDRDQCQHVVRLVLLHALFAVEDGSVPSLLAGLVDRLDREMWLVDGGAR